MTGAHLRGRRRGPDRQLVVVVLLALVIGLVLGAGVTLALMGDGDAATVESDGSATSLPQETDGVAAASPDPGPITLAFVGDINVEHSLATRLAEDPANFVGPFADVLRDADLAVGNLEAALTDAGAPIDKEFTFLAPPETLGALQAGGLDIVSVANNHAIDYGPEGLARTLEIKAASDGALIGVGGNEDDAYEPHIADVAGHRVAVIAAAQEIDPDAIGEWTATADQAGIASAKRVDRLVEEVEAARAEADTVVVFLHWGGETETCPDSTQQELARQLVDAGADVIVGTNAHRVQGGGYLDGAFVGYGVGNFLFGAVNEESAKTGVLLVEVDGRDVLGYEWRPGRIEERVPIPLAGDEAATAVADWNERRSCTGLSE